MSKQLEIAALQVERLVIEWDAELDPDPTDRSMKSPGIEWQVKCGNGDRYHGYVDWHKHSTHSDWTIEGFFGDEHTPAFSFNSDGRRQSDLENYLVYQIIEAIQRDRFGRSESSYLQPEGDAVIVDGYRRQLMDRIKDRRRLDT